MIHLYCKACIKKALQCIDSKQSLYCHKVLDAFDDCDSVTVTLS